MKMKKRWLKHGLTAAVILIFGFLALGSGATTNEIVRDTDMDDGQSVVTVKRTSAYSGMLVAFNIFIDGVQKGKVGNGEEARMVIPNGRHAIQIRVQGMKSEELNFLAESNVVSFNTYISPGLLLNSLHLTQVSGSSASNVLPQRTKSTATTGFEGAVNKACGTLIEELPLNISIAVLSVSSKDIDMAAFAMDELEFQLVDSGRFTIVDRKTLEAVRTEQKFQITGDVDDNSAVSIGKMLGANIVITGAITGSGSTQRLTLKALDVQTAKIVTMAREQF
jgi:hypothetical protein